MWVDRSNLVFSSDQHNTIQQSSLVRAAAASLRGEHQGAGSSNDGQQRRWGRLFFSTEPALQNAGG
jgi:hypothetical protein